MARGGAHHIARWIARQARHHPRTTRRRITCIIRNDFTHLLHHLLRISYAGIASRYYMAKNNNNIELDDEFKDVTCISDLIAAQNAFDEYRAQKREERKNREPRERSDITVFHYVKQDGTLSGGVRIVLHKGAKDKMSVGDVQELTKRNTFTKKYAKAMIDAINQTYETINIHHALQANKACRAAYEKKYNTTKVTNW